MDKIENFLKFTLPTIVIASLSYEICYLWGLDISIAETPLSNGDILRGWQQWYLFLSPLVILTIYPDFIFSAWTKLENKLIKNRKDKQSIIRTTLILRRILLIIGYALLAFYLLFGDLLQAFFILSLSVFIFDLIVKMKRSKIIEKTSFTLLTSIILIASIVGSFASLIGIYDKYDSLFSEDSYIEVDSYKKTVIRTYENWTLVRYGFESYAWLHHQSDRKIINNADRTHFLGAICYIKRNGYLVNGLTKTLCLPYEKIKTIEDDKDENCLLYTFKRDESKQEDLLEKCLLSLNKEKK